MTPQLARHFEVRGGVVVTAVEDDSPAARAGLVRGMVITGADGQAIRSMADWDRVVTAHGPGETVGAASGLGSATERTQGCSSPGISSSRASRRSR